MKTLVIMEPPERQYLAGGRIEDDIELACLMLADISPEPCRECGACFELDEKRRPDPAGGSFAAVSAKNCRPYRFKGEYTP